MFLISIFKKEMRRSGKDRRKSANPENIEFDRRNDKNRRSDRDRRSDVGRRSGSYYTLSDKQKDTLAAIVEILEREGMESK